MTNAIHAEIRSAWDAAVADAALDRPAELWIFDGSLSKSGDSAVWWDRNADLSDDPDACSVATELADARRREVHTIALWHGDRPLEINAAILRHELTHARQFEVHGAELLDLRELMLDVMRECTAPKKASRLYGAMPLERDANVDAATYARSVFGEQAIDELLHKETRFPGLLRRYGTPEPIETLLDRMIGFLAAHGELCDLLASRRGHLFGALIDSVSPGASTRWAEIRSQVQSGFPM